MEGKERRSNISFLFIYQHISSHVTLHLDLVHEFLGRLINASLPLAFLAQNLSCIMYVQLAAYKRCAWRLALGHAPGCARRQNANARRAAKRNAGAAPGTSNDHLILDRAGGGGKPGVAAGENIQQWACVGQEGAHKRAAAKKRTLYNNRRRALWWHALATGVMKNRQLTKDRCDTRDLRA